MITSSISGNGNRILDLRSRRRTPMPEVIPEDFSISSIVAGTVNMRGGSIWVGLVEYAAVDTALAISVSPSWLGWEYSFAAPALTLVNFGSTFAQDDDHIRAALWQVEKVGTFVRVIRARPCTTIFPANFGS